MAVINGNQTLVELLVNKGKYAYIKFLNTNTVNPWLLSPNKKTCEDIPQYPNISKILGY